MSFKQWRIFCETEDSWKYIWDEKNINSCPANKNHKIVQNSISAMITLPITIINELDSPYKNPIDEAIICNTTNNDIFINLDKAYKCHAATILILKANKQNKVIVKTNNKIDVFNLIHKNQIVVLQSNGTIWEMIDNFIYEDSKLFDKTFEKTDDQSDINILSNDYETLKYSKNNIKLINDKIINSDVKIKDIIDNSKKTVSLPDYDITIRDTNNPQIIVNKLIDSNYNQILNISNTNISETANIDISKLCDGTVTNDQFKLLKSNLVTHDSYNTFTNKIIDADLNNITNINNDDISETARIDMTKIGDGLVTNKQINFLSNLSSEVVGISDNQILINKTIDITKNNIIGLNNLTILENNELGENLFTNENNNYLFKKIWSNNLNINTINNSLYLNIDENNLNINRLSGILSIKNGGTGGNLIEILENKIPLKEKGDLLICNGKTITNLPLGNDGQILIADTTKPCGLSWENQKQFGSMYQYNSSEKMIKVENSENLNLVSQNLSLGYYRISWTFKISSDINTDIFSQITINDELILDESNHNCLLFPKFNTISGFALHYFQNKHYDIKLILSNNDNKSIFLKNCRLEIMKVN